MQEQRAIAALYGDGPATRRTRSTYSRKTWFNNLVLIYTNLSNHTNLFELVIIHLN